MPFWTPGFPDLPHFTGHSSVSLVGFSSSSPIVEGPRPLSMMLFSVSTESLEVIYNICMLITTKFLSSPAVESLRTWHMILFSVYTLPKCLKPVSQAQYILPSITYSLYSTLILIYGREWHHCSSSSSSPKPKRYP